MPPELHLPEAILRVYVPFGKEKVIRILGVDVWDAVLVAVDVYFRLQPGYSDVTISFGEGAAHGIDENAGNHDHNGQEQRNQNE